MEVAIPLPPAVSQPRQPSTASTQPNAAAPSRERPRSGRSVARDFLGTRSAAHQRHERQPEAEQHGQERQNRSRPLLTGQAGLDRGRDVGGGWGRLAGRLAVVDRRLSAEDHGAGGATVLVNGVLDAVVVARGVAAGGLAAGGLAAGGLATGGLATGGLAAGGLPTGGLPTGGLPTRSLPTRSLATGGLGVLARLDPEHLVLGVTALRVRRVGGQLDVVAVLGVRVALEVEVVGLVAVIARRAAATAVRVGVQRDRVVLRASTPGRGVLLERHGRGDAAVEAEPLHGERAGQVRVVAGVLGRRAVATGVAGAVGGIEAGELHSAVVALRVALVTAGRAGRLAGGRRLAGLALVGVRGVAVAGLGLLGLRRRLRLVGATALVGLPSASAVGGRGRLALLMCIALLVGLAGLLGPVCLLALCLTVACEGRGGQCGCSHNRNQERGEQGDDVSESAGESTGACHLIPSSGQSRDWRCVRTAGPELPQPNNDERVD